MRTRLLWPSLKRRPSSGFSRPWPGILLVTNEYRHGTVMTTFLAEPRRERVLGAKLVVALLTGAGFGLVAMAVSTLVAAPWLAWRAASRRS